MIKATTIPSVAYTFLLILLAFYKVVGGFEASASLPFLEGGFGHVAVVERKVSIYLEPIE